MEKKLDSDEVIVEIPGAEQKSNSSAKNLEIEANDPAPSTANIQVVQLDQDQGRLRSRKKVKPSLTGSLSIEIPKDNRVITIATSQQQVDDPKPKSRFGEQEIPASDYEVTTATSPKVNPPVTPPRMPIMASPTYVDDDDDDDDDDEGIYWKKPKRKLSKKTKVLFIIEFGLFVCITLVLLVSTTMNKLKDKKIWSLELWKWCGLGLAIFCGRLFSECLMNIVRFLIEKNLLLRKNVVYFVYAAHKSIRVFIWLGLILLTWVLLINRRVHRSINTTKVLNYVTRGIASTLVVAGAWIIRTILVKFLYTSFYEKRFFDRIQENIFHQYILQTLSRPPLIEDAKIMDSSRLLSKRLSFKRSKKRRGEQNKEGVIDMQKLHQIKRGKVSAWTMSQLIKIASQSGFYTYFDESEDVMEWDEQNNRNISSEWEAKSAGHHIFRNVAKPGSKYIEGDDLLRFMIKEEVDVVLALVEGAVETGRTNKKSILNWVVNMYMKSKFLEHSLNDIKEAIKELNKFVTGLLVAVLIILWVILMGIVTTEVLLFISSQFLLAVFTFGSSAKSAFEAMIFVFVKHPFDVGDRCVIDGVQVVVEEVSILTTVFLRYDNEKIYYPNSILATKSISNFNRSPEMRDTVEFDLDVSTSVENISALKAKIKTYIESNPQLWRPKHSVRVREIEDVNKMKMRLYVTHTINFQDYEEKSDRISNLVLELRNIFQQLGIKYHILPPTTSD